MDAPLIRYVHTSDGVNIAYWTFGDGPPLVILPVLPYSHMQMEWDDPAWRRGWDMALEARTIVRYDGRGTGSSQRGIAEHSLETFLADLDAVFGAIGNGPAVLYGIINSSPVAIAYAARHPERVSGLILWCPLVQGSVVMQDARFQAARQLLDTDWVMFSEANAHALLGWSEPEAARRFAAMIRACITREDLLAMVPALRGLDVRELLPQVRSPTLVLHRPGMGLLPPGTAEEVAATIPGARLALFDGESTAPYLGDWRAISRTIGDFLGITAAPKHQPGRRAVRLLTMKTSELSPRECEVVELVARGMTNREIAQALVLAEKTVENHIGRILVKLDLHSRVQLAAYAVEHGLAGRTA